MTRWTSPGLTWHNNEDTHWDSRGLPAWRGIPCYDADGKLSGHRQPEDGDAVFNAETEKGYIYSGGKWLQFASQAVLDTKKEAL